MMLFRAFLLSVAIAGSTAAQALVCPLPESVSKPGVIEEPEATIAAMGPLLSSRDAAQRAGEIVAHVRKRYPTAKPEELVNFLITAYCPVINSQDIGEAEKQALVNGFAAAVTRQLY